MRELFSPPGSDSVSSWSAGRLTHSVKLDCNFPRPAFRFYHDHSQPPSIPATPPDYRPTNHLCHDQSQSPSIPASPLDHCPTNHLCYNRILSIQPSQLDLSPSSCLQKLSIGFHLSCRGGKRKQRKISVVFGARVASTTSNDVRQSPGMRSVDSRHLVPVTDIAANMPPHS